jgi:hypothetical protein
MLYAAALWTLSGGIWFGMFGVLYLVMNILQGLDNIQRQQKMSMVYFTTVNFLGAS